MYRRTKIKKKKMKICQFPQFIHSTDCTTVNQSFHQKPEHDEDHSRTEEPTWYGMDRIDCHGSSRIKLFSLSLFPFNRNTHKSDQPPNDVWHWCKPLIWTTYSPLRFYAATMFIPPLSIHDQVVWQKSRFILMEKNYSCYTCISLCIRWCWRFLHSHYPTNRDMS